MINYKKAALLSAFSLLLGNAVLADTNGKGQGPSGTPGGFLSLMNGELVDTDSGLPYTLSLWSGESPDAGVGIATIELQSPEAGVSACTVHGPGADVDFAGTPPLFTGITPLPGMQCGFAGRSAVVIDGCKAELSAHAYVHSDFPTVSYLGSTTVDLSLNRNPGNGDIIVEVTLYTPKEKITARGRVSGEVILPTCG